jgi:hypothetical protein
MKLFVPRHAFVAASSLLAAFMFCIPAANSQTTSPASGALNIHVTAVQGQAQYRSDSGAKWKPVEANTDLPEGVEFRTGPKGAIQFTVGTDQVFRVDRLTVVKVLQANLNSDGTIRTDVGMTYGRVSKDVDLPAHPHQDTITTPCSTLAVRGTQVSMYDQPPYTPEAISLTGTALFHFNGSTQFAFGSKGGGTNKVAGDTVGAAQNQLNTGFVDPNGNFAGHTSTDVQNIQNNPGAPPPGPVGNITQHTGQIIGGMTQMTDIQSNDTPGLLTFSFFWSGNASGTNVQMQIHDPNGRTFSSTSPPPPSLAGPNYQGSPIANIDEGDEAAINGHQAFLFGNVTTGAFKSGNYDVTLTLKGIGDQPLNQVSFASISGELQALQLPLSRVGVQPAVRPRVGEMGGSFAASDIFQLNSTNPSATFTVTTPIVEGTHLVPNGTGTVMPSISHKNPR